MGGHFDLDNKNLKISELEQKLQEEGIWSDPTKANQINNELTNLKKIVNKFNELKSNIASSLDLLSILNGNDINEVNELEENFNNIKSDYEKLETEMLLNGKYDNLSIDDRLNISINGKKSLIPASKLSKGTVEQIYMALRLAAADIIFEKDKKPILLDDAFVMYDNKRMGNTMKFMAESMEQVIIFSCHTREKVMADKLKIHHNFIKL